MCGLSLLVPARGFAQPDSESSFRSLLERGFALHEKSDYANALPLLERACVLQPHDYFANLLVGIELLRTDRPKEALVYLHEASRQRPREDFPYEYMGEAQMRLHHYSEAVAAYESALVVAPSSPQAVEGAVGCWVERFRELAGQLRSTTQGLAAELRLQARAHTAKDPERLELLSRSASLDPNAPGIRREIALTQLAAAGSADADIARAQALPVPSDAKADGWLDRGVALANLGRYGSALPALEQAAATHSSQQFYVEFVLSWCYAQRAEQVMQRLSPDGGAEAALSHMVRGDVLLRMRADSAAAAAEYGAAVQAHPGDPELLERLAEAQYEHGEYVEAVRNAQASLHFDPYRTSAMETLARIAIQQRSYADAVPYLRNIVARDPRNVSAQVELGSALAQTGSAAEAVEHLLPALNAGYPDEKGSLHSVLGAALRKTGRSGEAMQAFARARELSDAFQRNGHRGGNDPK